MRHLIFLTALALLTAPVQAQTTCGGTVVGVGPIETYSHAKGTGFLAVRTGPGTRFSQLGELYLGDQVVVMEREGDWFYVACAVGQCNAPYWGEENPEGWSYGGYLRVGGVCP